MDSIHKYQYLQIQNTQKAHGFSYKIVLPELDKITVSTRNITKVLLDLARQAILHTFIFQTYCIYNVQYIRLYMKSTYYI